MIVGRGLVAKQFDAYRERDDVIIFASGVSNSGEVNEEAYQREIDLLTPHLSSDALLVYFSTVSVHDPSLSNSRYIAHKRQVEALISAQCSRYLILRLPNLIGRTSNPHTFFNFFYESIRAEREITIYEHARRYFLDAEDLPGLFDLMMLAAWSNRTIDVSFDFSFSIDEVVVQLEKVMQRKAKITRVPKGSDYSLEHSDFVQLCKQHGRHPEKMAYLEACLRKYLA